MWGLAGKENIWDLFDVGIGGPLMWGVPMYTLSRNFLVF